MNFTENSRQAILNKNPISELIRSYGIEVKQKGKEMVCLCPFHEDRNPSMRIQEDKGVFFCDPCGKGGSVIDFVSMKENISIAEAFKKLSEPMEPKEIVKTKEVCRYSYQDEKGDILYKVVRFEPKTFRQCRLDGGKVVWNMDGVRRVLYNLPQVLKTQNPVWIVEGEKDADNLIKLFQVATCNVGGAGKWLDGYGESLSGKEVIICPDNDEAGKKHADLVMDSLAGKVKSIRLVKVPPPHKDISDAIASFSNSDEACNFLLRLISEARVIPNGINLPIHSVDDLEDQYVDFIKNIDERKFDLSKWLPGFKALRGLSPGDMVGILADTGVGKTAILQNIALHCSPLSVLCFNLELPPFQMYERFVQIESKMTGNEVEHSYRNDIRRNKEKLKHIFVCSQTRLTPKVIEEYIHKSELKIGRKPDIVMVDYMQLLRCEKSGSRYEMISQIAEDLRVLACSTQTIIFLSSQISRKQDEETGEIFLHDAKDSGSIENSVSLLLGAWREPTDKKKMNIKVLKSTKGGAGLIIPCEFHGDILRIYQEH